MAGKGEDSVRKGLGNGNGIWMPSIEWFSVRNNKFCVNGYGASRPHAPRDGAV